MTDGIPITRFDDMQRRARMDRESESARPQPMQEAPPLELVCAASFAGQPVPERRWHVDGLIPAGTVTGLSGDGATGKSTIALQLGIATVIGGYWFGMPAERGPAIYLTAEDDLDEVQRRLDAICGALSIGIEALADLHIAPLAHRDALLAVADSKTGALRPTDLFAALDRRIAEVRPALVTLDTKADLFGGDENNRAQARQFIGMLRALAIRHGTTVLLLDHPSLGGLASGTGTSGSTAWNNSLRSRLYFSRVRDDAGKEPDVDARSLAVLKSNYARAGTEIAVRWDAGVFKLASHCAAGTSRYGADDATVDAAFLACLDLTQAQGRPASATYNSPRFAPRFFSAMAAADGFSVQQLKQAMERLFMAGAIVVGEVKGPDRHGVKALVRAVPRSAGSAEGAGPSA